MVGRRVSPALTVDDAQSYVIAVKEAFHDEPTKFEDFTKLLNGIRDRRVDKDSVIARVEELMKDHQDLLLGFNDFLPAEAKRIKHPETKKAEQRTESAATKKKHADADVFMKKLKTRFQSLDTDVVGLFRGIMKIFKEGKMSVKEVREEVIDILYYHEDLIEDFLRLFKKNDPVASASLLLRS